MTKEGARLLALILFAATMFTPLTITTPRSGAIAIIVMTFGVAGAITLGIASFFLKEDPHY